MRPESGPPILRPVATKAQRLLPKLLKAIFARDVAATRALLDAGADPNGTGGYNAKPLGSATAIAHDEAARDALTALLLERGADPNDRGPYGHDNRPIYYAAYCGYEAVVRMLLARGGFPRDDDGAPGRNSDGMTLLALGCASGMRWLVDVALAEGCRADDIDRHGSTALHYATVMTDVIDRPSKDTADLIDLLLARGAPLEHQRPGDWGTATHWALGQGDPAALRALRAHGADLEARTERSSQTPMHQGARYGGAQTLREAVALGASVTAVDANGATPLHLAALRVSHANASDPEVIALLLAAGADPDARDAEGKTPLERAAEALPRKGKRRTPLEPSQSDFLAALVACSRPSLVAALKL